MQSRYYDPDVKRFINADGLISVDQEFLGNNLYTYCGNNPITYVDYTGNRYDVSGNPSHDDAETVRMGIQASQSGNDNSKVQETQSQNGKGENVKVNLIRNIQMKELILLLLQIQNQDIFRPKSKKIQEK